MLFRQIAEKPGLMQCNGGTFPGEYMLAQSHMSKYNDLARSAASHRPKKLGIGGNSGAYGNP
jgi:hypothetical protein